jgi:lipase (class 3)
MSGMRFAQARAPSYPRLRPFRPAGAVTSPTFPVHRDLVETLLRAHAAPSSPPRWDPVVAHVLATIAGYAYADAETVAMIAARLGLEDNRCAMVAQNVPAMFICSTAFLVQSRCGRVAILSYRGTEPGNFINWLTDADVNPEAVPWRFGDQAAAVHAVHAGFYRNVRATRYAIGEKLGLALQGKPIVEDGGPDGGAGALEALYVTGHSLGAAMAAMFGAMMETNPAYGEIRGRMRAIYTYGQPMIGDPAFASECGKALGEKLFRFIHAHDVVAALPPRISGPFAHFGEEIQLFRNADRTWRAQRNRAPMGQVGHLFELPLAASAFLARQLRPLRDLPFQYSLDDHGPQHYIAALTPPGVRTEFGD